MAVAAVVLAAGRGRRMGADKALLQLGPETAIERVLRACHEAGAADAFVVRARDAAELPGVANVIHIASGREMIDSVRAGVGALRPEHVAALVFPVDYAMVAPESVRQVIMELEQGAAIALPLHDERPGHPIGLARSVFAELGAVTALRDVVRADPSRVRVVPVDDGWVRRDLDTPADLEAARAAL